MTHKRRHKLFLQIIAELHKHNIGAIATKSEVHWTTLYNWINGDVYTPRSDTLFRVAAALGFELKWERKTAKRKKAA